MHIWCRLLKSRITTFSRRSFLVVEQLAILSSVSSSEMKLDKYEEEVLAAFEADALLSIATKEELEQIRESARATATKDQRINIRLSAGDLRDIQVKAMQEGMPYQTLIASVLHKYVTGRLAEKSPITHSGPNGAA